MRKFMKFKTRRNPETKLPSIAERKRLFDKIEHGSSVTILTPQGNTLSGRAVMLGDYGWVLNAGGRHGTPRLASVENIVAVRAARGGRAPKFDFRSIAGGPQKPWTIKAPRENPSPGHRITGAYCDKKTCFKIASKVSRRGRTYCAGCAPAGSISIDDYNHENALALAARRNPSSAARTFWGVCPCTKPSTMVDANGVGWCKTHAPKGSISTSKASKLMEAERASRVSRSNPSQQPVCALVKETERGEEVVSTHSSTELAEAAMRRCGGEPGTPFKNGFDIVYLRGHEIVKLPGGRRVIRVKSRANPSGGVGGASSPYGGKKPSELVPKRHIEMFVGKYHVSTPDEEIVAALAKKIDSAPVKWPANARKYALEYAVRTHHKNRDLYVAVMSGR